MDAQKPWHRLFGLSWTDFCRGLPITVEMEKDLSLKQQFLDVLLIHKFGVIGRRLPDGFEELATYNLVTFKSFQEVLDVWALLELIGHYVNCRKQFSASMDDLLPESEFRLFAVCVRFPQKLAGQVPLERVQAGVYAVKCLTLEIRVVVIHELPEEEQNAMLHLFSANMGQVRYAVQHYRPFSVETSTVLNQLFQRYRLDEVFMSDKLQEFVRETIPLILKDLSFEERLEGVPPEKRLEGVPLEKRLEGFSAKQVLAGLSAEQARELLEEASRSQKANGSSPQPE